MLFPLSDYHAFRSMQIERDNASDDREVEENELDEFEGMDEGDYNGQ